MKTTFTYTVLRYVHDIATGEFVNLGVALYAPEAKYVSAICNSRYGRLSKMFLEVNGDNLRSLMRYIQARLQPKRIVAKDYDHEFDHAWKNGVWNLFQPVSMDLLDADSILDKANRWLGRATNLKDSADKFRLWMLIGEPRIEKLKPAYSKALNILNKMPGQKDFVTEHEARKFSEQLAREMAAGG